jgi:hypothetical protein
MVREDDVSLRDGDGETALEVSETERKRQFVLG